MTKIISVANHKGGVGKTSSVASIGAALAQRGYKTLLVDLDAQANLTASLLKDEAQERTIYNALKERKGLPVVGAKENLYITPSSLQLSGVELELSGAMSRESILRRLLNEIEGEYDFILLDCPPAISLITINALVASSDVLIPLTAETLPFVGLTMLEDVIGMIQENLNPSLRLSGIFLTRWQGVNLNKMIEEALREKYGERVLSTKIRTNIAVAEAPLAKEDIFSYDKRSNGAADYSALTEELLRKILLPKIDNI